MGRSPCGEKVGLKKGPWTPEEDQKLMAFIEEHGYGCWRALPAKAGLQRCGKSCRLRWTNYLRPDIKRGKFSLEEDQTIIRLHAFLGNKWSIIAAHLPKRTDNEIKNHWNTHLKKRLTKMGIDPITHKPKTDVTGTGHSRDTSNLSHMAQWESARLEAEARLVRENRLQLMVQNQLGSTSSNSKPARLILNKISHRPSLPSHLDVLKAWQRSWCNPQSNKDHTRMHDMYAMMLNTDDLESPTSTLCFPESTPLPISTPTGTLSNNFLSSTTTALDIMDINVAKSSASYNGSENGAILGNGSLPVKKHKVGDLGQHELEDESYGSGCAMLATTLNVKFFDCKKTRFADLIETSDNETRRYLPKEGELIEKGVHDRVMDLQDDNIVVAVEAFRAAAAGYTSNDVMEACLNDDVLYDSNESLAAEEDNLGITNGDSNSCDVNYEDNDKHYWNSLLNIINDLPSGSPVF